jgi:hypothetical protein
MSNWNRSSTQKLIHLDATLAQYGPQRALSNLPTMMGNGRSAAGPFVPPDLVAAACLAIELKAKRPQLAGHFRVLEAR